MSQPQASFHVGWRIQDLLNAVFHSVPKILVFLLLAAIGWFAASAAIVIVALGVSAALNQAGVTAAVRQPVLYTVLLTCGAILAIGVGGGLVKPVQARLERMLAAAERETDGQLAVRGQGQPAPGQPSGTQRQGQPSGPRYLQNFSFSPGPGYLQNPGFTPGPGYHQSLGQSPSGQSSSSQPSAGQCSPREPVRQEDPGISAETGFQDDPDNYPGGQYM
jgi:hypothetical protein